MEMTRSDAEARQKVWDMIHDIEVAMLVTSDAAGRLRARPMRAARLQEFDGTLWFFTRAPSPKTEELRDDDRVLLAYADPSHQNYVSVFGRASVVRDAARQRELWAEPMRAWFPKGAEDPEIGLIRVETEGAEYWDSPSATIVHAYGYVKALVSGEPPNIGDNDKVDLRRGNTGTAA